MWDTDIIQNSERTALYRNELLQSLWGNRLGGNSCTILGQSSKCCNYKATHPHFNTEFIAQRMSLPDDWFIDYDQQTLASKLKGVNYDVFAPAERDILPNELNKIEFSLVKYESILQRHFVAQHNVTHSFFNTESLVSEDSAFQLYAKTMLNFIKAEINYCYYFWQNERFLDHLVHRLDASLLRTYYFLLQLHKRLTRAGSNRRSVWTPDQSLEDMIEYLVVPLPDLAAFIQFFEKTFEDLYHKLSPLARSYQLELNLIIAIWTVSNMYIDYCFEDIVSVSSSKFSHKDEQTLKETLLGRNETFRVKQDEKPTETVNNEQDSLQKWLAGHVSNSAFVDNISQHAEKENFSLLESVFKREETTISEFEDLPSDNKSKGSFLERLHNNKSNNIPKQPYQRQVSRPKSSDQSMLSSASGLSSVSNMKFSTLGLSSLNSVKESPNNPLAKNSVMHSLLSDSADEHDLRAMIARSSKMNKKQQVISHFNHNILSKLDSDSDSRDQLSRDFNDTMLSSINKRSMYSMQQSNDDEYLRTMKSKLSENLYRTLIGEKEEQKYSEEELAKQRMQARAGGFLKSLQKSMKVSSMDDPNKLPHGNGGSRSADEMKSTADHNQEEKQKKEKQKKMRMEEEFLKLKIASETMMSEQLQYIPSKENKGDDIPDEEILKEIIGGLNYSIITPLIYTR